MLAQRSPRAPHTFEPVEFFLSLLCYQSSTHSTGPEQSFGVGDCRLVSWFSLPAASPVDRAVRACLGLDTLDSYTAATSIHRDHNSGKHTIRDKAIQWTQVYKPCQAQVIFPFQNSGPQPFLVQNLQNHLHFSLQKTSSSVVLF